MPGVDWRLAGIGQDNACKKSGRKDESAGYPFRLGEKTFGRNFVIVSRQGFVRQRDLQRRLVRQDLRRMLAADGISFARRTTVAVDASFMLDQRRRGFLDLASSLAVPAVFIHCQAAPDTIQRRLGDRGADASDADWTIYEKAVDHWETFSPATRRLCRRFKTQEPSTRLYRGQWMR